MFHTFLIIMGILGMIVGSAAAAVLAAPYGLPFTAVGGLWSSALFIGMLTPVRDHFLGIFTGLFMLATAIFFYIEVFWL